MLRRETGVSYMTFSLECVRVLAGFGSVLWSGIVSCNIWHKTLLLFAQAPAPSAVLRQTLLTSPRASAANRSAASTDAGGPRGTCLFLILETYGSLCETLMPLAGDVGQLAADRGQGVLRELSVDHC
jgi:hypothetical protein